MACMYNYSHPLGTWSSLVLFWYALTIVKNMGSASGKRCGRKQVPQYSVNSREPSTCDLSTSSVPCWLQVPTSYGFVETSHWVGCSKLFLSERGRRVKKPQEEKLLFHFKVECVWGRKGKLPDIEHPLGGEHGRWLILKLRRAFVQWKAQDLVFPSSGGNAINSKKVSEDSDLCPICF